MRNIKYNVRLKDYNNLLDADKFNAYNEKININYMRMASPVQFGGNPLAFAMAAGKLHIINDKLNPPTAATDGENIFWHPTRLEELSIDELYFVLEHEILHICLGHTLKERLENKVLLLWNIAADFKVNSIQERSYRQRHRTMGKRFDPFHHPIWNGNLGIPITLDEIIKIISSEEIDAKKLDVKTRPVDMQTLDMTVEQIYNKLIQTAKENGVILRQTLTPKDINLDQLKLDVEDHKPIKLSKNELIDKLSKVTSLVKLPGAIPGEVSDFIEELTSPEIDWIQYCTALIKRTKTTNGLYRDWTKFKRRHIHNKLYIPKNNDYKVNFAVLLDTSLSMSRGDITFGVSQLQTLVNIASGKLVPVDSKPYWDHVTTINRLDDIKRIDVVGRGGTVFNDFFKDYKKNIGNVDLIIVITDGQFGFLDSNLKPSCNVLWVVVNYSDKIRVPFGKILPLYGKNHAVSY